MYKNKCMIKIFKWKMLRDGLFMNVFYYACNSLFFITCNTYEDIIICRGLQRKINSSNAVLLVTYYRETSK